MSSSFASFLFNPSAGLVTVDFHGAIGSEANYLKFLEDWLNCYEQGQPFSFVFNTADMHLKWSDASYVYKLAKFMQELRLKKAAEPVKYGLLQESIIIVESSITSRLLTLLFSLKKPISTVTLCEPDMTIIKTIEGSP